MGSQLYVCDPVVVPTAKRLASWLNVKKRMLLFAGPLAAPSAPPPPPPPPSLTAAMLYAIPILLIIYEFEYEKEPKTILLQIPLNLLC
eukprot:m.13765 g.13765  ORF g.13765 m.13765 type:complete len:88 (-) comp4921_c0_seq1:187-450(-)